MRKLIFALAAAGAITCAAPANAQTYWYATPMGLTTGFAPWGYQYWGGWPGHYRVALGAPALRAYATVPRIAVRRVVRRAVVRRANVLGAYAYAPFVGVTFGPAWVYE
jgi:hypothetical protein